MGFHGTSRADGLRGLSNVNYSNSSGSRWGSMELPVLTVYMDYLMSTIATVVGPDGVPWNFLC